MDRRRFYDVEYLEATNPKYGESFDWKSAHILACNSKQAYEKIAYDPKYNAAVVIVIGYTAKNGSRHPFMNHNEFNPY